MRLSPLAILSQMLLPLMGPMISIQANLPGSQRGQTGPILPLFEQVKE